MQLGAPAVAIEVREHVVDFAGVQFDAVVREAVLELFLGQALVAVRVHDGDGALQGLEPTIHPGTLQDLDEVDDGEGARWERECKGQSGRAPWR